MWGLLGDNYLRRPVTNRAIHRKGACGRYFVDLLPLQCHFLRERLLGELGSDLQPPSIFALRAQYASPLAVPGRMRSPPSLALPACPYLMVFCLPVSGFVTTFLNLFSISGLYEPGHRSESRIFYKQQLNKLGWETPENTKTLSHCTPRASSHGARENLTTTTIKNDSHAWFVLNSQCTYKTFGGLCCLRQGLNTFLQQLVW